MAAGCGHDRLRSCGDRRNPPQPRPPRDRGVSRRRPHRRFFGGARRDQDDRRQCQHPSAQARGRRLYRGAETLCRAPAADPLFADRARPPGAARLCRPSRKPAAQKRRDTAMRQALWQLLNDFLSAILFLVVYLVSGNLILAAALAIAVGVAQLARLKLTGRRIEPMQWMSLGLVILLGGLTLVTQSPRFMMAKPSIVHFAIAAIMLRRGWMARYMPEIVQQNVPAVVITATGYAWAALMAALGLANLVIAVNFDFATWAWFVSFGAVGAKVVAFALQYVVFRTLVRRRLLAAAA